MITEKLYTEDLSESYDEISSQLLRLTSSLSEEDFNVIPFEGSWTAAQVCEHIIKSNKSIAQALKVEGKITTRNPDQRVLELKDMFTRRHIQQLKKVVEMVRLKY